jgi:hypothetical protein
MSNTNQVYRLGNISRPVIIGWVVVDKSEGSRHVSDPYPAGPSGERDAQNDMRKRNQGGVLTRYAVDAILA